MMAEKTGYSGLQIGLHWAIGILIVMNWFVSDGMEESFDGMMEGGAVTGWTPAIHVWTGVAVLVLVAIRLLMRLFSGVPEQASGNALLDTAGRWGHRLLYALMIAGPALGAISWFGMVDVTASYHVLVMNALLILALGHSVVAIFHQFVLKDGLLMRMIRPN
jgi:cytochrome b561